ncbi:MAG: futalosine hydrolase [Geobacteraceae bacterium]
MKPLLVTAAIPLELRLLILRTGAQEVATDLPLAVYTGKVGNTMVIISVTGIGKVNAAASISALLARYKPGLLINTGCAGAYMVSGLAVGDLAMASAEIFGDEGVLTPEGWEPFNLMDIPLLELNGKRYFNMFPLSPQAAEKAVRLSESVGQPLMAGRFVTVSTCSGTSARGEELGRRFGAICENMEGAAAAQVALMYGVECLEIRGVSNLVEDRDLSRWNIRLAVERAQQFVLKYIETL